MSRGFLLVLGVLIVAVLAVAIPSLLRARVSAGEAPWIGDTRTVITAQTAYAGANGGFYDGRLQCLSEPSACIPGYAPNAPIFLDAALASLRTKSGYKRFLYAGPPASREDVAKAKASPTSVQGFAYVAVPAEPGKTGIRAFCGDASGIVCFTPDGTMPTIEDGRCPVPACTILQ
jgi:hypothetical protein